MTHATHVFPSDSGSWSPHERDIERAYYKANPGGHFFDRDTMKFFGSRVGQQFFRRIDGAWIFVTSERDRYGAAWHGKRRYTVRIMDRTGWIEEAGDFGEFATRSVANRVARDLAKKGRATWKGGEHEIPEGGVYGKC